MVQPKASFTPASLSLPSRALIISHWKPIKPFHQSSVMGLLLIGSMRTLPSTPKTYFVLGSRTTAAGSTAAETAAAGSATAVSAKAGAPKWNSGKERPAAWASAQCWKARAAPSKAAGSPPEERHSSMAWLARSPASGSARSATADGAQRPTPPRRSDPHCAVAGTGSTRRVREADRAQQASKPAAVRPATRPCVAWPALAPEGASRSSGSADAPPAFAFVTGRRGAAPASEKAGLAARPRTLASTAATRHGFAAAERDARHMASARARRLHRGGT
mmetsp:Transcript_92385/g.198006  ORF Transcript_92385/g.198006 Transcript_92385/m.198006 type:complete len:276 (+) Transcript_92385:1773-2600(+)